MWREQEYEHDSSTDSFVTSRSELKLYDNML